MSIASYVLSCGAALFGIAVVAAYFFVTRNFSYWRKKGVKYLKPLPFVGNLKDVALLRKNIGLVAKDIYDQHKKEPYIGLFAFDEPVLQIHDLDLVKAVLVKDFQYFYDRSLQANAENDPLAAKGLFGLKGEQWKRSRNAITPCFTSGKMRRMYELVDECGRLLVTTLGKEGGKGKPTAVYEIAARYTTDVIATCGFGIHGHALENPNSKFRGMLRLAFEFSPVDALKIAASFFNPKLLKLLGVKVTKTQVDNFIRSTISSAIKDRETFQIKRNDLLGSLMQLKSSGRIVDEDEASGQPVNEIVFDEEDMAGHSMAFLTAGFETSATTMTYALYELATHTDVQERLRQEIAEFSGDGLLTYEIVHGMKYLDMVLQETLRKYPPLPFLDRIANKAYTLPGTNLVLERESRIMVPVYGLHMDPELHPNPKHFVPERFSEENKRKIAHYAHMPFGEGPRNCVGMRFALLQTKTAIAHIVSKYSVQPCSSTPKEISFNPKTFLLQPKEQIVLVFQNLQ